MTRRKERLMSFPGLPGSLEEIGIDLEIYGRAVYNRAEVDSSDGRLLLMYEQRKTDEAVHDPEGNYVGRKVESGIVVMGKVVRPLRYLGLVRKVESIPEDEREKVLGEVRAYSERREFKPAFVEIW